MCKDNYTFGYHLGAFIEKNFSIRRPEEGANNAL